MIRTLALSAVLLAAAPGIASAATSKVSRTFTVTIAHADAVAWYEARRDAVLEAANCRIEEVRGEGHYQVLTDTPLGACRYVLKESKTRDATDDGRARTIFQIDYVQNVSGRIVDQQITISLTESGEKTEVGVELTTSVSGRLIPTFAVRRVQNGCLAGCQNYIVANAR